jgi:hypothetical protein
MKTFEDGMTLTANFIASSAQKSGPIGPGREVA